MRATVFAGVVRGRRVRTTVPGPVVARPFDCAARKIEAECLNRLWVFDSTDVATWSSFV
jgi:putative transposase